MWSISLVVMRAQTSSANLKWWIGWRNEDKLPVNQIFVVTFSVNNWQESATAVSQEPVWLQKFSPLFLPSFPFLPTCTHNIFIFPEGKESVCNFHCYESQCYQFFLQKTRWYTEDSRWQKPAYCTGRLTIDQLHPSEFQQRAEPIKQSVQQVIPLGKSAHKWAQLVFISITLKGTLLSISSQTLPYNARELDSMFEQSL